MQTVVFNKWVMEVVEFAHAAVVWKPFGRCNEPFVGKTVSMQRRTLKTRIRAHNVSFQEVMSSVVRSRLCV